MNLTFTQALRKKFSVLRAQTLTLTGLREGGFFIQYDHVDSVPATISPYPEVETLFATAAPRIDGMLERIAALLPDFEAMRTSGELDWYSRMFSPIDTMTSYTIVRDAAPSRVLEIGSGSSTHVLARAVADSGGGGVVTCIDPAPRREIASAGVELARRVLSEDDVALVDSFGPGDVLFIDSSHIMLPGMDVDLQFNRMFPRLAPGVLVHVHDIFLPDDYPCSWRTRRYSEQNALIGWLISGYFEVVFPGHYAITRHHDLVQRLFGGFAPFISNGEAGGLWLRRTATGGPSRPERAYLDAARNV